MKFLAKTVLVGLIFIMGCGSAAEEFVPTQTDPYISRVDPAAASVGDVVAVFGHGFSDAAEFNIIVIDDTQIFADSYALVTPATGDEVESLAFTVPAGISQGDHTIYVIVCDVACDNTSNTDLTITINP